MTVTYVGDNIATWTEITDLLALPANYEDLNISLTNGSTLSVYGFDAENTVVILDDDGTQKSCHCFVYADATDYDTGKSLQTPDQSLRV